MNKSRRFIAAALLAVSVTASAVVPAFAKVNEYEGQHKIMEYEGQHKVNEYEGQHKVNEYEGQHRAAVNGDPSQWASVKLSALVF